MAGWIEVLGSVANQADLPAVVTVSTNQGYIVRTNNHLWTVVNGVWTDTGRTLTPEPEPIVTGLALGELVDVVTAGADDQQALVYDEDLGMWGPGSVAASGVAGATTLGELSDVDLVGINATDLLGWDGIQWIPRADRSTLDDLDDVDITGTPEVGDTITWDGSQWVKTTPASVAFDELSDVDLSNVQPLYSIFYDDDGVWRTASTAASLSGLVDVDLTGAAEGWFITFDESEGRWLASAPASAAPLTTAALVDVDLSDLTVGDTLVWDSIIEKWLPVHFETFAVASTEPDPEDVRLWLDIDDDTFWAWDGSAWVQVGGVGQDLLNLIMSAAQGEDIAAIQDQLDNAFDLTDAPDANPITIFDGFLDVQGGGITSASGIQILEFVNANFLMGIGLSSTYASGGGTTTLTQESLYTDWFVSSSQSISDHVWTNVAFDTRLTDPLGLYDGSHNDRIVFPDALTGLVCNIEADIPWTQNATGYRAIRIAKYLTAFSGLYGHTGPIVTPPVTMYGSDKEHSVISTKIKAAGSADYYTVQVFQNSGNSLDITNDVFVLPNLKLTLEGYV